MLHAVAGEGLVEDLGVGPGEVVGAAANPVEFVPSLLDALKLGVEFFTVADAAAEGADIVEHVRIEDGGAGGMAAAHREAGDGARGLLGDGPVVLLDEGDDLGDEALDIGVGLVDLLGGKVQGTGSLLSGIAVRHDHDHRLCETLLDEVVEDLGGAAHRDPGFLVAAGSMQEIEDGIFLLGIGLVAVRGVDGQTAVEAEDLAVIPGMAHGSALVGFHIVLAALSGDYDHAEETGAVPLHEDVLGVVDGDSVHDEVVGVDLRTGAGDLDFPDVVGAADHVDGTAGPGGAEPDIGRVVGAEAEGHAVVLDLRGNDAAASSLEVRQFLGVQCTCKHADRCDDGKDSFHLSLCFSKVFVQR